MGPHECSADDAERERRLNAARDAFPDWDITVTPYGYEAVPKGTPVLRADDVEGIVAKIQFYGQQQA